MDLLLKVCTWRNLALAAAAVGALQVGARLQSYPRQCYLHWRYPPQQGAPRGGDEIMRLKEQREAAEFERRVQRVLALLGQSEAQGFDVSRLRSQAEAARQRNASATRRQAALWLAEVELGVPRKKTVYAANALAGDEEEVPADVPGRRLGRTR